jgi:hypothetical protein
MISSNLRRFRILFSAIVLICFFAIFLDFRNLVPSSYISTLLAFQFIPSLLKFHDLGTMVTAGFVAVLILTFLSGRTYY